MSTPTKPVVESRPRIQKGLDDVYVKETTICFVDGQRGRLLYRGYDIRDLAVHSTFEETAFLLLRGRLPNRTELAQFRAELAAARALPEGLLKVLRAMPKDAPPMDVLRTSVSLMGDFDPERDDGSPEANQRKALRIMGRIATVVAAYHRLREGRRPVSANPELAHAEDFLRMVNGRKPDRLKARIMDVSMVLYADHSMNASSFAATVAASTRTDLYSTIVAAIATLKGPLHGGAIEAALHGVEEAGSPERAEEYVLTTLRNHQLVYGFGHRVYKTYDPRALIQKDFAAKLAAESGDDRLYRTGAAIEETVVREIGSKGIFPNVDFYTGLVYHYLGLPTDLFTPIFSVARSVGWTAHVMEYWQDNRLVRPLDYYVGPTDAVYVPLDQRS
jgi:citrate synthase